MIQMLRWTLAVFLLWWDCVKGDKTFHEIKQANQALGSLQGFTLRGFEITIYCHRRDYLVKYRKWYIPNTRKQTYNLFSVVSHGAPWALRKACELDVDLPSLSPPWGFKHHIRKQQVLAYLDLLEARITEYLQHNNT